MFVCYSFGLSLSLCLWSCEKWSLLSWWAHPGRPLLTSPASVFLYAGANFVYWQQFGARQSALDDDGGRDKDQKRDDKTTIIIIIVLIFVVVVVV